MNKKYRMPVNKAFPVFFVVIIFKRRKKGGYVNKKWKGTIWRQSAHTIMREENKKQSATGAALWKGKQ